jgi:hypothetical protein
MKQLRKKDDKFVGISYREFFRMCGKQFIASTEALFRTQLVELKDHSLVVTESGATKGEEMLRVPLSCEELETVLENMEE